MEQFEQLGSMPFQPLHHPDGGDSVHQPSNTTPNNNRKCPSTSPPGSDLISSTKNYQILYGTLRGDGNISPGNPNHNNEDGNPNHHSISHHSDGEEGMSGLGIIPTDSMNAGGKMKTNKFAGQCKVCGDDASGMYFGALVCVPCKVS